MENNLQDLIEYEEIMLERHKEEYTNAPEGEYKDRVYLDIMNCVYRLQQLQGEL